MIHWWKSLADFNKGVRRQVKINTNQQTTTETVKTRNFNDYPSETGTQANWGKPEYARCVQPYSWAELIHGYKDANMTTFFKMGGLSKRLEVNGYETWQCFKRALLRSRSR